MIEVGQNAPEFTLPDQNGALVSLSQYRGNPVALYFYPKDNTPGCTREACSFRNNWSALEAEKFSVLGVSADPISAHLKFHAKLNLPFPLLSDPEMTVIRIYNAFGEKNMYGKRVSGILRTTFLIGADGTIIRIFKRPKSAIHAEEILVALKRHGNS